MRLYPCLGKHLSIGLCFGDVGFQHLPRENYPWKGKRPWHFTMAVPVERGFPMWSPAVHAVRVSHSFVVLPCHQPHTGESGPRPQSFLWLHPQQWISQPWCSRTTGHTLRDQMVVMSVSQNDATTRGFETLEMRSHLLGAEHNGGKMLLEQSS